MRILFTFLVLTLFHSQPLFAMEKTLTWRTQDPTTKESIVVGEKGSIQEAYIAAGKLPNPHVGMNEKLFDWFEEHVWVLTAEITLTKEDLKAEFIDLALPSVDTYAQIQVNGKHVLSCNNAFAPYRVEVKSYLHEGKNLFYVTFTPPVIYHKKMYEDAAYKLPAENDKHPIAIAPYTRKPQYQFGWDWTMRMTTIGFNKPVKLISYNTNRVIGTNIQTKYIGENKAEVQFQVQLAHSTGIPISHIVSQKHGVEQHFPAIQCKSKLFGDLFFTKTIYGDESNSLDHWYTATVTIENPQLWWPVNHGDPFLYNDEWQLATHDGKPIDTISKRFGIRTAELLQTKDTFGTAYEIVVNGRKIFCKGGDYIPQEIFPAQVTDESVRWMIDQMADANFNMVRVWGGGYYPDEVFFDACDEKGIMVWQDFMFACAMYPGDDAFLATVQQELNYHIPRMTSHPSVVLLNGNNEVMIAWKNWGFQRKFNLNQAAQAEIEMFYENLFQKAIPKSVQHYSTVPYVHTSPLSNWGKDEFYNHGSQHYWGVWHGKDPIEDLGTKIGRFNAEYGFQSFPEYSTLAAVIDKSEWNLNSETMKLRQKSYVGNGMIKKHADNLFGKTDDFETFIYYSQLTQSRAVSMAIAGHRSDWPRCSGTLYWQVNDCWPAPTWSTIDYKGNWKALHYEAKKDYENVAIVASEPKLNNKAFALVSDWTTNYSTDVSFDFYDLTGNWLEQHRFKVDVIPQAVIQLPVFSLMQNPLTDYIVRVKWKNAAGTSLTRTFFNNTKVLSASSPQVELQLEKSESGEQTIVLTTNAPLINCWIYAKEKSFHLDRNFETLLPGTHVFKVLSGDELKQEDLEFRITN